MTADEYEDLINNRSDRIRVLEREIQILHNQHILPLQNQKDILFSQIRDVMYGYESDEAEYQRLNDETYSISQKIKEIEKSTGIYDKDEEMEKLENEINSLKANAKYELDSWNYNSSYILPSVEGRREYFRDLGLESTWLYKLDRLSIIYKFTQYFDYTGKTLSEKVIPFVDKAKEIKFFPPTYDKKSNDNIILVLFDGKWQIIVGEDVLFEHEDCIETFQYYNLIR